ncbi:hypothetical protein ABPG75_003037 [Micractinium tetrahymenae]
MKKSALRLPKLKTRDELLRTAPELGRFLATGDEPGGGAPSTAGPRRAASPLTKPRSPGIKGRAGSPQRLGRLSDDEITEEDRVRAELERVKAERATLLDSLAKLRNDAGKSGGELQQEDIRLLRRELEAKKEKLNELRRAATALDETLAQLETTSRDCEQLMPSGEEALQARVAELSAELAAVEQDILEAEAKHELYKLLETRTRRDHAASEQRMREARALKEGAADDYTTLTKQMHEMRAAKEDAERELGGVVAMYDQVRGDWGKKLRDRRKEVRELEKRKSEDDQRKQQQAAIVAEKARIEQEKSAKTKSERDAANARLSVVVPQLEALEATWARLHGICGANDAEELLTYWKELKAKEASMRELVRLAEVREARAKQEMAALLAERAEVFDTDTARGERRQAGLGAAAAGQSEAAVVQQEEQRVQGEQDGAGASSGEEQQAGPAEAEAGAQAEAAPAAATAGETSVGKHPCSADTSADSAAAGNAQGPADAEASPAQQSAEEAGSPAAAVPAAAASPEAAVEHLLREKQLAIAEARRRKAAAQDKFSKLSQVCVAADQGLHLLALRLKAALEAPSSAPAGAEAARRRTTVTGPGSRRVTSLHRRTTGQHVVRRISAASLKEHRSSIQFLPAPVCPADSGSPRAPAGTSIHDREFFPELPSMLSDVSGRLGNLLSTIDQLQVASAAASDSASAAAQRSAAATADGLGEGSLLGSSSSLMATDASEAAPGGTSGRSPSKKLQWADGQAPAADGTGTPRVGTAAGEGAAEGEGDGGEGEEEGEEASGTPVDGEKALRKGFRRRTWAGPAWLDAVRAGKPLTASLLRKQPGSRGVASPGAGGVALQRIVGYVEEPGSSEDEAGAGGRGGNPFDLGSSEDELDGEDAAVLDRQYLKHRAQKLTNPKTRTKRGGAAGSAISPTVEGR